MECSPLHQTEFEICRRKLVSQRSDCVDPFTLALFVCITKKKMKNNQPQSTNCHMCIIISYMNRTLALTSSFSGGVTKDGEGIDL